MFRFLRKYWKYFVIFLSIIMIVTVGYFYNENNDLVNTSNKNKLSESSIIKKNVEDSKKIEDVKSVFVDVKGAVNAPGVYEINSEKRIIDAINLAGGLLENADTINLNLSKKVSDEMFIIVYTKDEIYNYKKNNSDKDISCASVECVCPDTNNDACIEKKVSSNTNLDTSSKISINSGSKEELMTISGIGESKANAIISYRNENGSFKSLEDIKNVSGIGDKVFEKIKDKIAL